MASISERAKDKVDTVTSKARNMGHKMADKAKQGAKNAGQKMKEMGQKIKRKA